MKKTKPTEDRKRVSASVSARFINAIAPVIRQVAEMTWSEVAFMSQVDTRRFGVYLMPAAEGILIAVVDNARLLLVRDPVGQVSESIKVHFPGEMLEAIKPRSVELFDENGSAFEVESEPKAGMVFCSDLFGMVATDAEGENKWKGIFGTWHNSDHGNVIDASGWRAEPADVRFIQTVVSGSLAAKRKAVKTFTVNPDLLAPISQVAETLKTPIEFLFAENGAIIIRSSANSTLLALLMPMQAEPRAASHLIESSFVPSPSRVAKKKHKPTDAKLL